MPSTSTQVLTTVVDEPVVQKIIEQKNISVVNKPVVTEIHDQLIIEVQKKPEVIHKKANTITNESIAPTQYEVIGQSTPFELPRAPETQFKTEKLLETIKLPEEVKEVVNRTTIERHVIPEITQVRDQTYIKRIDVPVIRTVLHNVIVREVQPTTLKVEPSPIIISQQPTITENINQEHLTHQHETKQIVNQENLTTSQHEPKQAQLQEEFINLDEPIITHPSFVPEQPSDDHCSFQAPVIEHPIIEQLHNHPNEPLVVVAPMLTKHKHKKSVSFNSLPPQVYAPEVEESPLTSKSIVQKQILMDQMPNFWSFIAPHTSFRFVFIMVSLLVAAASILSTSPYLRSPNHFLLKTSMSYLTFKESIYPSNSVYGESSLTCGARALNRFLESNAHRPDEGLVQYRKGMRGITSAAPPLSKYRFAQSSILNDSLLMEDHHNKCVGMHRSQKLVILYLHAGGFISGEAQEGLFVYKPIAEWSDSCVDMLSLNYRLCPEHSISNALDDGYAAFEHLKELGYRRISVMGSSAGGGIAISLSARLEGSVDHSLLHSMVLFSPFIDYSMKHQGDAKHDVMFNDASVQIMKKYLPHDEETLRELSPLYGLSNMELPRTFLSYSTTERVSEQCTLLSKEIESTGNGVVVVDVGLPHIAPIFNPFVQESLDIMKRVVNFLSK
ncbi:hypothetical protein AKO1_010795 [Acrasis kona]|uniref:Alpha/beta hydrolase fold-3 domain-containing protein n=1 Tax=Acrasis kona TaxID=1008807 RepID=A0AAW2YMN0_9EUKA